MSNFNDQTSKLVDLGFIYCLKNPTTDEIFYIGATESTPKDRLAAHYSQFKEYLQGKRNSTKKFVYFEKIFPEVVKIEILEIVQNDYLYQIEIKYISEYSNKGIVNQTKGGTGGDTFTQQQSVDKSNISQLIALKNASKTRTEVYKENLRKLRLGSNNPMAGLSSMPSCIVFDINNTPLKKFIAPFEITTFFDNIYGEENHKIHAGRVGNITKALKKADSAKSSNYTFKKFDLCPKEIQDIVQ